MGIGWLRLGKEQSNLSTTSGIVGRSELEARLYCLNSVPIANDECLLSILPIEQTARILVYLTQSCVTTFSASHYSSLRYRVHSFLS